MNKSIGGELIKSNNEYRIFGCMRKSEDITIADIASQTGLSLPTVTRAVNSALSKGLVITTELRGGEKGRRAQCYSINEKYCYSLLIVLHGGKISLRVISTGGHKIFSSTVPVSEHGVLNTLNSIISDLIKKYIVIKNVFLTMRGNIKNGYVSFSPEYPELELLCLEEYLSERFGVAAVVKDFASYLPYCGQQYVSEYDSQKVAYILLSEEYGCGASISVNGYCLSGASGTFGLIKGKNGKPADYTDLLTAAVSFFAPDSIVVYSDGLLTTNKLIEALSAAFPDYLLPRIICGKNVFFDVLASMQNLAFNTLVHKPYIL